MRLVIIESPFAAEKPAELRKNEQYALRCVADCLKRHEAPIVSHLLFPQLLDDTIPDQRRLGIAAGLAWSYVADAAIFYLDRGWSFGMIAAKAYHESKGTLIEERHLDPQPDGFPVGE